MNTTSLGLQHLVIFPVIIVLLINWVILKSRLSNQDIGEELKSKISSAVNYMIFLPIIPLLILFAGVISGAVSGYLAFFNFGALANPLVIIFHAYFLFVWYKLYFWIYKADGAYVMHNQMTLIGRKGIIQRSPEDAVKHIRRIKAPLLFLYWLGIWIFLFYTSNQI